MNTLTTLEKINVFYRTNSSKQQRAQLRGSCRHTVLVSNLNFSVEWEKL